MTTYSEFPPPGGGAGAGGSSAVESPSDRLLRLGPEATLEHLAHGRPKPGLRAAAQKAASLGSALTPQPVDGPLPEDREAAADEAPASEGEQTAPRKGRILAIDAARGLAFLGMVAIHTLPALTPDRQSASFEWTLFAGHAAALFALLAGVSLAFSTGGSRGLSRERAASARTAVIVRALVIFLIGLTISLAPLQHESILIYYGAMFLMAVPFLRARIPVLLGTAAAVMAGMPFAMQAAVPFAARMPDNPTFADLARDPAGCLLHLLLTGVYPAASWMAFVLVGLAIGRLDLRARGAGAWLFVSGAVLALLAHAASTAWLLRFGGYDAIAEGTPSMSESEIDDVIVFGPNMHLPTTTPAWLVIDGPHTNTPFALAFSLGLAVAAVGLFLGVADRFPAVFRLLAFMGSMTLTLYTSHLLLMTVIPWASAPQLCYWLQVLGALVFASAWMNAFGRGPLEAVVTFLAKGSSRIVDRLGARRRQGRAAPRRALRGGGD